MFNGIGPASAGRRSRTRACGGFQVMIFFNDHPPPHVHVRKGGGVVMIQLASADRQAAVRDVHEMSQADVVKAFRIVHAHHDLLEQKWREIHG
jgi:hypothetical protein